MTNADQVASHPVADSEVSVEAESTEVKSVIVEGETIEIDSSALDDTADPDAGDPDLRETETIPELDGKIIIYFDTGNVDRKSFVKAMSYVDKVERLLRGVVVTINEPFAGEDRAGQEVLL